jgi:hypothetical protein
MGVVPTAAGHRLQPDESRLESNGSVTILEHEHARNADELLLESLGYKQVKRCTIYIFHINTSLANSHIWNSQFQ